MIVALKLERNDENFLRLTKELLDKYPKEKFTYFVRGIYFQTRKMFGPAIENLEKAIELDPNYAEAVNQLAYIFAQLGDLEKAIESLKKYAAMIPGDANPFDSMGEIYFRMGKLDDAISKYKEALEVKPDFYSSLLCMGYVCCFKEEYAEGEKWFARAIETMPSGGLKSEGYFDLGDSRFGTGRYEKLMGDLQQSFELAAAQGNGLLKYLCDGARGWVHYERGELEASKSAFRRSFEFAVGKDSSLTPRYLAELNLNLGLVDLKEGKIEAARSKLREIENEVSKVDPVSRDVIMFNHDLLHAELLLAQDSLDKAIAVCEGSVLMGMPTFGSENMFRYNYPFIRDTKARVYIRKGDIDKAIAEYERIVTIVRDSKDRRLIHPKDHYRLATLYEKKGLKEKAISQYRRFLEIWKDADRDLPEPIDVRKRLQILTRGS
jgi:tetratricopeptide (TPR) repeat protein